MAYAHLTDADCLAMLRAYAFSHDTTLDSIAQQLASTQLHPKDVAA